MEILNVKTSCKPTYRYSRMGINVNRVSFTMCFLKLYILHATNVQYGVSIRNDARRLLYYLEFKNIPLSQVYP
jgi:hypothetical protein